MNKQSYCSIKIATKCKFVIVLLAALLCFPRAVDAASVNGIRSTISNPIVVRGGVLLLPLTARKHGNNWPSSLKVVLSDARKLDGQIIWIHRDTSDSFRHWTVDPRGVEVREIKESDDSSLPTSSGAAFLVVRVPIDADGQLNLGNQRLRPQWYDLPTLINSLGEVNSRAESLSLVKSPDLPDPSSPFEYFRWVLLAQRRGVHPPNPESMGKVKAMVAQHYADLSAPS